jgi:hypothetical protein
MTEEEIEWFEENWGKGKTLKGTTTDSREFKSVHLPRWYDWEDSPSHYYNERHCWKTKRRTHYKLPKVKKKKKRKVKDKEHRRYKKSYHNYLWFGMVRRSLAKKKKKEIVWEPKMPLCY